MGKKNKDFWNKQNIHWYRKACAVLNYPKIPLDPFFDKIIRHNDTVLDLGCGIGPASLYLAKHCDKVLALDPSQNAIDFLSETIRSENIDNIEAVCGRFPETKIEPCDVTVILYVNKLIKDLKSAKDICSVTKREGLVLCTYSSYVSDFQFEIHEKLGIDPPIAKSRNDFFIVELFESLGLKVEYKKITHNFGQPFEDFEDAFNFLLNFFHIDSEHLPLVKEVAPKYLQMHRDHLYFENIRESYIIHFSKE